MEYALNLKEQLDQYIFGPIGGQELHSQWPMLHELHKKLSCFLGSTDSKQAVEADVVLCDLCLEIANNPVGVVPDICAACGKYLTA